MASSTENSIKVIWGLLVRLVMVSAAVYFLYRVRSILICVLVAVFLAYALLPVVEWLCRKRVSFLRPKTQRLAAVILVFVVFLAFVAGGVTLMVSPITNEVNQFSKNLRVYTADFQKLLEKGGRWYASAVPADVKEVIGRLDYSRATNWIGGYAERMLNVTRSSIGIIMELVLIPVLAFYFVLDHRTISREVYGLVPKRRRREAKRIGHNTGEILQSYVVGQLILCAIAGVLTAIFLEIVGMPYVVVLALFAGITRAIPVIGPVISGIPIILVGMLYFDGLAVPIYLLVFVVVMHFAESKFVMPRLIGDRMRIHPAAVVVVLLIGAEFFGVLGMFIAAPVAAVVRDLLRFYYIRPRDRTSAARRPEIEQAPLVGAGSGK